MRTRDDLTATFCRGMPDRIAEATELWLGYEQGRTENLPVLRRLLHTVKGEAHMLEFNTCGELAELAETVVDAVRATGERTELTGDSLLGAMEAICLVTGPTATDETADLDGIRANLRAAAAELRRPGELVADRPVAPARSLSPPRPEPSPATSPPEAAAVLLRPEDVSPPIYELRRLYGEQEVFHKRLREGQRMLRALLAEIDPRLSPELLAERITKTLGYGSEIDRLLTGVRAEWAANEFAMGRTLEELEQVVGRASVVSTDRILNQVQRVGRSTARAVNKDIEFRVRGTPILDAGVEQRLEPALIHLVRNAVDHGIERAEVRRSRGKPERGVVSVSIDQSEGSVRVEITDDGGGVDFGRLRETLTSRIANVDGQSNEDLLQYLFEHGVTTAEQVTQISGRGVGLDVVAREVGAAGGQVRFERTGLMGTTVVLVMPTTLRGELAVPVVAGNHRCAVPSRSIHSVTRLESVEAAGDGLWTRIHSDAGAELVRVCALTAALGGGGTPRADDVAMVLYHPAGLFAVTVESYDNPRPINILSSEELPFRSPVVRGVAPTPDGGVLLLLAVDALYGFARGIAAAPAAVQAAQRQTHALVVEDAPVARELLCGVLRSIGLRVDEATDGRQGLLMARRETPDVILTDLEMPHMDGIQMVTELRNSPTLSRIPVIVLTTAASDANRSRLSQLGVVAVLSKQKFVEQELCELISRCVKVAKT
ncbi:MAG: response regulator [Polyangiaceae bacterium]|nr:response regulator [Polyangiaceae bacterium]